MNIQLIHLFLFALKPQSIFYDEIPSFHLRYFPLNKKNYPRNLYKFTYIPRIKALLYIQPKPNIQNKESLGLIDNILEMNALF